MRQPWDWALLLFLLTALAGVFIAADKGAAAGKLGWLVGAYLVYTVFALLPENAEKPDDALAWVLGILPALMAVYFLLTNDWSGRIGKIPAFDPVMQWLSAWQLHTPYQLNSNATGGVIAMLLPLQAAALWKLGWRRHRLISAALLVFSVAGLILSASRGAWFALGTVSVVWAVWKLAVLIGRKSRLPETSAQMTAGVILAFLLLAVVAAFVLTPLGSEVLSVRQDRVEVWKGSLNLLADYPFTGVGPGNFGMAYSTYVLLVRVVDTTHAHNLYLDIWLEQGLAGIVTFFILVALAVSRIRAVNGWQTAALAALAVVLLHGFVDDAFYGYQGLALPFLLIPFALIFRPAAAQHGTSAAWSVRLWPVFTLAGCALGLVAVVAVLPAARAVFVANVASVMQTQAELSIYSWPAWPIQDAVRRTRPALIAPAVETYDLALQADPLNATANRRLGQILLAQGDYTAACGHLREAFAAAPGQRPTRQLVGECAALEGNAQAAAAMWHTIDNSQGQLEARQWWYAQYLGDAARGASMAQAISQYQNP